MAKQTNTTTATTATAAHAVAAGANVQAANAQHVIVWLNAGYAKSGMAATRWRFAAVGNTLAQCRNNGTGYSAADVRWGQPRGLHVLAAPGSKLLGQYQAATAKGAKPAAVTAFVQAVNAQLAAQYKGKGNPPVCTKPQAPGTVPAQFA